MPIKTKVQLDKLTDDELSMYVYDNHKDIYDELKHLSSREKIISRILNHVPNNAILEENGMKPPTTTIIEMIMGILSIIGSIMVGIISLLIIMAMMVLVIILVIIVIYMLSQLKP